MASKATDDEIVWSDEVMTIRDVVYNSTPAVVRVAEGFYGGNEAESFSRGDLLKLDFVRSIQKVYATIVSSWSEAILEDGTGYMQPDKEIVIPLGYKGKVTIVRPPNERLVYFTVDELMREFPRFVRVDKPFIAQSNQDEAIKIEAGKKLELDRFLPTQGLVAQYDGKTVVLSRSVNSRFVPLPDDTQYTLMEVVDRLPLPQFVRFVEDEFQKVLTTDLQDAIENVQSFTGCVKLKRVFREEVVVGHHKPQIPDYLRNEHEKYVHRSIVLLPLGRDAVNEIEVNVPIYSEPDEYELLVVRNFTQKTPNMDVIDGSLYLEFAKNPRSFYLLDDKEESSIDPSAPPPIPPRPGHHHEVVNDPPPKLPPRPESDSDLEYEQVDGPKQPPAIVPRPGRHNIIPEVPKTDPARPTKTNPAKAISIETKETKLMTAKVPKRNMYKSGSPPAAIKDIPSTPQEDGPLIIYEVPDDYVQMPQTTKHKVIVPKQFYRRLKRVQTELVSRLTPKGYSSKPNPIPTAISQPLPSPTYEQKHRESGSPTRNIATDLPVRERHGRLDSPTKTSPEKPVTSSKTQKKLKPSYVNTNGKNVKPKAKTDKKVPSSPSVTEIQASKLVKTENLDKSNDDDLPDYDYPDVSQITLQPPPQRPIVRVQPSSRGVPVVPNSQSSQGLSQMSVKELVQCLHQCALPKIAALCDDQAIDGELLSGLTDDQLRDKPFCMNNIEVAKVKRMKDGWRPKME